MKGLQRPINTPVGVENGVVLRSGLPRSIEITLIRVDGDVLALLGEEKILTFVTPKHRPTVRSRRLRLHRMMTPVVVNLVQRNFGAGERLAGLPRHGVHLDRAVLPR